MAGRPLASLAAALIGGLFVAGAVVYHRSLGAMADLGRPAPEWTLPDLEGRSRRLAEWRGQAVVLNFWTTWCEPCREEIPALDAFHRRFGGRLAVVGVNVREPLPTVRQFVEEFAMGYPVVRDADGKVAERYRVRGFPESWLVDEHGILRRLWLGPLTFEALEQAYRELTGRPIASGLPDGGPLAGDEEAVGLARAGRGVLLASRTRLLAADVGADGTVGPWREVPLPRGTGRPPATRRAEGAGGPEGAGGLRGAGPDEITALLPWPGEAAVAVAIGQRLWRYEPASGRWTPAGQLPSAAEPAGPWLATPRGVQRRGRPGEPPVPVPGTPVRRFVGVVELPGGRLLAVAENGDLYQYDPGQGAVGWRLSPLPRGGGTGGEPGRSEA